MCIQVPMIIGQVCVADTENNMILRFDGTSMNIHAGLGSNGWFDNETDLRDSQFYLGFHLTVMEVNCLLPIRTIIWSD